MSTTISLPPLEAIQAEQARRSLRRFIEWAWPVVEPDVPFVGNWHIDVLCEALERVSRGETSRLIVNIPPGTAKSLIASVLWPAWEWMTHPTLRYLTASYSDSLTIRDTLRVRDICESAACREAFGSDVRFRSDQNQKVRMDTTSGGWRIATSVGGRGTGEHPDRIIIDDPTNPKEAVSDADRQAANDWFDRTISTRGVSRGARIVLIMQRLHEQDLTGHLLARGGWEHLSLPMRFDPHVVTLGDPRTVAGELLWPALFPEATVALLERDLGTYGAAGQLQQRPAPAEGGLIKRSWWRWYAPDMTLRLEEIVISVDTALKAKETNDKSAVGAWGRRGPDAYALKMLNARWAYPELIRQIEALYAWVKRQWPGLMPMVVIENTAAGPDAIAELRTKIPGVVAERPKGEKIQRLHAVLPVIEAGNVWLPGRCLPDGRVDVGMVGLPEWVEPFVEECSAFPVGAADDQVDMMTQAIRRLHRPRTFTGDVTLAEL